MIRKFYLMVKATDSIVYAGSYETLMAAMNLTSRVPLYAKVTESSSATPCRGSTLNSSALPTLACQLSASSVLSARVTEYCVAVGVT